MLLSQSSTPIPRTKNQEPRTKSGVQYIAMNLSDSVGVLKGVGPALVAQLATKNIQYISQLLDYFPRNYIDYSNVMKVADLRPGIVTLRCKITSVTGRYVSRGMHITEAIATDDTGSVRLVWFNQPYRANAVKPDIEYFISGVFELRRGRFAIASPATEVASNMTTQTARIVPIYPKLGTVPVSILRKIMLQALQGVKIDETLPGWVIKDKKLISINDAINSVHFPKSTKDLEIARNRLGFEEIFELTLASLLNKREQQAGKSLVIPFDQLVAIDMVNSLPFKLTDDQRKSIWAIFQDMASGQAMNRLLEGDVGSGKTVVAAFAAIMAMHSGHQVVLMAPTEILARQHAETFFEILAHTEFSDQIGLLIGALNPKQKQIMHEKVKAGEVRCVVGTHALFQDAVAMQNLGLVIVDEQHRFGVEQRKKLQSKAKFLPHVLHMTATPIPRSLALTLYGELDISIIAAKPIGRKPIITKIWSPNSRDQLMSLVQKELENKSQIFVVCPLITDSDDSKVKKLSVEKAYEMYQKKYFKDKSVAILHGKMKSDEKDQIMQRFIAGKIDILVSTTVIEVGVNVPNASVMIIENADNFGLAQVHQLRGRVGRGQQQGYCYLIMGDSSAPTPRLQALESSDDGFKLAELDLELRGPGAIYGQMQHGALDLRIAKLTDVKLIESARNCAKQFINSGEDLLQYKKLAAKVAQYRSVTNLN